MFAKIFRSIYDGTLAENWQALVTFQQMLILSNQDGVVDMTPAAVARTTGIPLEIIRAGIEFLEQPDPMSRSKEMDGQRIARLDPSRDWGWFVVNHAEYRRRVSREEKQETDRQRIAAGRAVRRQGRPPVEQSSEVSRHVARGSDQSQEVANVAHTDAEADAEKRQRPSHSVGGGEPTGARAHDQPASPPPVQETEPTKRAQIAKAMTDLGVTGVNPTHATLAVLIAAGADVAEFRDAATEAIGKGKMAFSYILATIERRRRDAAAGGPVPNASPKSNAPLAGSGAYKPYVPEKRAIDRERSNAAQAQAFADIEKNLHITRASDTCRPDATEDAQPNS